MEHIILKTPILIYIRREAFQCDGSKKKGKRITLVGKMFWCFPYYVAEFNSSTHKMKSLIIYLYAKVLIAGCCSQKETKIRKKPPGFWYEGRIYFLTTYLQEKPNPKDRRNLRSPKTLGGGCFTEWGFCADFSKVKRKNKTG